MTRKVNTLARVHASWAIIIAAGVGGFILAKTAIHNQRYEAMKVRERMKRATIGEYEFRSSRNFKKDSSAVEPSVTNKPAV